MPAVSESKGRTRVGRRSRPVKTESGEVRTDFVEPRAKAWWWVVTAVSLVVALVIAGGLQWHFGWVEALPHQSTANSTDITIAAQPSAAEIAATAPMRAVDASAVAEALEPYLGGTAAGALGPHVDLIVTGLTGNAAFTQGSDPITPASTLKLLTAAAALDVLGPQARFSTSVRQTGPHALALVGGGDPYLVSRVSKGAYPRTSSLAALARQTAKYLKEHGVKRIKLTYDDSLFVGPSFDPSWEPGYRLSVVPPIGALSVDEAVLPSGAVSATPAQSARDAFALLLKQRGITVTGQGKNTVTSASDSTIATVASSPLVDILAELLARSDNFAAEVVARHVAIAEGEPASFDGAVDAIEQVLRDMKIPLKGLSMHDGSGLSRHNRLTPKTLVSILRLGVSSPRFAGLLTGLPVAGFDGTLSYRFARSEKSALGNVRAKTGTLTGVHSMAGIAVDSTGVPLIFVAIADQVPVARTLEARGVLDDIGAALSGCACSVPAP